MGRSVQFIGKESVIDAYENRDIKCWGLFDGKSFIVSGEDAEDLKTFLTRMEKSGTESIYTLKVYKNVDDIDDLDDRLPCNGSFNFKLSRSAAFGMIGLNTDLQTRLDLLEKKVAGSGEDDEDDESFESIMMGMIKNPVQLQQMIGAVQSLFTRSPAPVVAAVGALDPKKELNEQQQLDRLNDALQRLEKADPNIIDHLCKLADVAERDPGTFKFLIKNLESL